MGALTFSGTVDTLGTERRNWDRRPGPAILYRRARVSAAPGFVSNGCNTKKFMQMSINIHQQGQHDDRGDRSALEQSAQ